MVSSTLTLKTNVLKELLNNLNSVSAQITGINQNMFLKFEEVMNQELQIINLDFAVSHYKTDNFSTIILSLCHNNIISLVSVNELIKKGFLENAKILIRNIYETLIIGKYIGITHDEKLYNKWQSGEQININQTIFKKFLTMPSKENLKFWNTLHKPLISHSSNFMIGLDMEEVTNCNSLMIILIAMNDHLLNTFVSKNYRYYLNLKFNPNYAELKKELNQNISLLKGKVDSIGQRIIREYQTKWILFK